MQYSGVQVLLHTPFTVLKKALLPWNNSAFPGRKLVPLLNIFFKKYPQIPGGENICLTWLCRTVWNKVPVPDLKSQSQRPWERQIPAAQPLGCNVRIYLQWMNPSLALRSMA